MSLVCKNVSQAADVSAVCYAAQVYTWVPQNDILGHPHVTAFLSSCGSSSMYEVRSYVWLMCCQLADELRYTSVARLFLKLPKLHLWGQYLYIFCRQHIMGCQL